MEFVSRLFGGSAFTAGDHVVNFRIPRDYGYVILVAVASTFMLVWMALKVGEVRKKFKIFYPTMYSATNDLFNCYQRAHQNTLEYYPMFLLMLLLGGLDMPLFCALAGLVFIAGRVSYAKGYYTGDPKNRMRGMYGNFGLIMLLVATVKMAVKLILVLE